MSSSLIASAISYPYVAWPINLALCSGGTINIIYSFGLGYAASMASNGLLTVRQLPGARAEMLAQPLLSVLFGARLFLFLLRRQVSESYVGKMVDLNARTAQMPLGARLAIVGSVGTLIALYNAPLYFTAARARARLSGKKQNVAGMGAISFTGLALSAAGLIIETVADEQKHVFKTAGGGLIQSGFYSLVRHPNYSGEILFHAGMILSAVHACDRWWKLAVSALAPAAMIAVMFGAAKSLDARQAVKYGADFSEYLATTPAALIPGIF